MNDHGFFITLQVIRRQLAAMPNELYLVRLIHDPTGRPCPGERLWTATLLTSGAVVRFLRRRNLEGCDVYFDPYTERGSAGYISGRFGSRRPAGPPHHVLQRTRALRGAPDQPRKSPGLSSRQCRSTRTARSHRNRQSVAVTVEAEERESRAALDQEIARLRERFLSRGYFFVNAPDDWRMAYAALSAGQDDFLEL